MSPRKSRSSLIALKSRLSLKSALRRKLAHFLQQRRVSRFESLEDRRLLAVTPLSISEAAAIRETTALIGGFAGRLETTGFLAETLPISELGIGSLVDIDAAFSDAFASPLQSYLTTANAPTVEGLKHAVDTAIIDLPELSGTVTVIDTAELLSFQIDGSYQRSVDVRYDLASEISADLIEIEGDLSAQLDFTLNFNITIGIDRTQASATAGAFVEFADAAGENNISASIDANGSGPIAATLGFLGVTLASPTVSTLSLAVAFDTVESRIKVAELTAVDLSSVVTIEADGDFDLTLPIETDLTGLGTINSTISILDSNLFDGVAASIDVDASELAEFRTLSASAFFNGLQQFQNTFGGLDIFATEIPFTGGKTLDEILSIGEAFAAEITTPAADPTNQDEAGFNHAQAFGDKSAETIQYIPATAGQPPELIFDVSFDHLFNVATFPIDFGAGIGELSIQADSTLMVDASLAAALEIGVKLEQPGASFGFGADTLLATLQGGIDIPTDEGVTDSALKDDIQVTLRDGSGPTRIDIQHDWTVSDLQAALEAAGLMVTFDKQSNVTFDPDLDPEEQRTFNQGLILVDPTTSIDGGQLKIEMLNGSLLGPTLGLFGQGSNGIELDAENKPIEASHGLRTGPLHGQSLANNIFIRPKSGESMFTATAALRSDINGAGRLGFIEIAIADGSAAGSLKTQFTPTYPSTIATDGRIAGSEVVELASAAKLRLQAQRPVKFGEAYAGELQIEISKADGSVATLDLAFGIQAGTTMADVLIALNAQLIGQGGDGELARVVSSGEKLNFLLTDGVGRLVTIKPSPGNTPEETAANQAAVAKLGINEELSGFVATPAVSGSAHFELPFNVDFNLGSFSLPALSRTLSFSVPDLTVSDFSLPENINLDDLGLGTDGYLQKLQALDRQTIVQALSDGLDLLRKSVEQSPLFSQPLPMLNIGIREVLDFSESFAEVIANINGTEASGLGQMDEVFEDIFGVAESNGGGPDYPAFPVWILPTLNSGLVFDGVALDSIDSFPAEGKDFLGQTYTNLVTYLGALQSNKEEFGLRIDETGDDLSLRIDLPFDVGNGFGIQNQVDPLGFEIPISLDLSNLDIGGMSNLIDARGDALVSAYALGQINLSVGIELPETGSPRPFLYDGVADGTSLGVLVRAAASPFGFDVSLGPIGAALTDGDFTFDGEIIADPQSNRYANFRVGIDDNNGDGRHYFDEIVETVQNGLELSNFEFAGDFDASLVAQLGFSGLLGDAGLPIGPYVFEASVGGPNLTDLLGNLNVTINGDDPAIAFNELKDALAEDFNLLALVGGWDGAFDLIIEAMEGEVFGVELPFVGDKLKDQANFLRDIKDSVSANFSDNASNQENGTFTNLYDDVRQDLLDAVGPNGINLLLDLTGDDQVTIDDIVIEQLNPGIGFQILLGNDLGQLALPIDFDLGIPGLNLDIDANVTGTLGFELGLHFGVNLDHGFFIDTTDSFMQVFVDVGVPGLSAAGELGFLRIDADLLRDESGNLSQPSALVGDGHPVDTQFTIESKVGGSTANFDVRVVSKVEGDTNDFEYDSTRRVLTLRTQATTTAQAIVSLINATPQLNAVFTASLVDGSDGSGVVAGGQRAVGVANSFAGRFTVDILDPGQTYDGMLTLSEILAVKSYKDVLDIDATAHASLDLELLASFGGSNAFPSIQTDLLIDWRYLLGEELQIPQVEFRDISLDVGQFFNGFAGKVLEEANNILEPVRPIIEFLSEPVPVVSDLAGGNITMLDLLKLEGGKVEKAAKFIESVADFDRILQNIPDLGDGKLLNLGGATYTPGVGFTASDSVDDVALRFKELAPASGSFDPEDFLKSSEELESAPDNKIKLGFPLLDPSNIMGLLSGQVINLFTLELPTLELNAGIKKYFPLPIFPAVGVELGGAVSARADFAFGFDTHGIQQFLQTGDFEDVFNGFFVWDHETADGGGADISEVQLKAQITAAAALNAGFFKASVGGGLFANIDFDLHDNNEDGKVRLVELLDNTLLGTQDGFGPIHIFDVDGKLDAGLFASITVGLGPFSYTENFDLARVTLFEFSFPRPEGDGVPLAQMNGSTLELNIGPDAHRRLFFFTEDVAEDYRLYPGPQPGSVIVEAFGRSQLYNGVSRITGDAGLGNDKIVVSTDISIPIELYGGPGNDTLIGGSGDDTLRGGDGDDELRGGLGNDLLEAGVGRDYVMGEAGDDVLRGGVGDDQLFGGDGDDFIYGEDGNDVIHAGGGNDTVYAGVGFDTVHGDGGDDQVHGGADGDLIYGGEGSDTIHGDEGDDRIFGDAGNDVIYGGIGNDVIRGGNGNDTMYGDDGDDQLFGENGRDVIYGGEGLDVLQGGLAADELYGGFGNDHLYANTSDPSEVDEARHVLVGGAGDDLIYASPLAFDNLIYGDGVNDELGTVDSTLDGSDEIFGGAAIDVIHAGGGADVIHSYGGNDFIDAGSGDDIVYAGDGNDFVIGGFGDDQLYGQDGEDVLWGGFATLTDLTKFDRSTAANIAANFVLPLFYEETEAAYPTGYLPLTNVTPAFVAGLSIAGIEGDGRDLLEGGNGVDMLFGGAEADVILGAAGDDYIDAGAGDDNINGGDGNDVIRGGAGNDVLHGAAGIDHILGDGGDDQLFGDVGNGSNQLGQRLFGGDGSDTLYAYAPTGGASEYELSGDQLFGGADGDTLNGNVRREILVGGAGDDLLRGDFLAGPNYAINPRADQDGGGDFLYGEGGEDKLFGGGGDDIMWGGSDTDYLDGQKGNDTMYGGGGNDLFVVSAMNSLQSGIDIIDGHFGNFPGDTAADDDATDVLIINGSQNDDIIGLSQTLAGVGQQPQLRIDHKSGVAQNRTIFVNVRNSAGKLLVEQFQVAGLAGDDIIGFAGVHPTLLPRQENTVAFDVTEIAARGDWTSTLEGNSGNDIIIGSKGRDRAAGGPGSDTIYGFAGDDRLIGDSGDGFTTDVDRLYAGQGNDDLTGGQGTNYLYSWSLDPGAVGIDFGIFVDEFGNLASNSAGGTLKQENTGLNRMLGNEGTDHLYGGTLLDFMYGRGGSNTLYRSNGTPFESLGDTIPGDEWKEYAKETGQVWYVSGTNANDEIAVNFVTEPGLLSDHHLITRLTDNNGNVTFDAQVRLDFAATDADGNAIWTPNDLLADYAALRSLSGNETLSDLDKLEIKRLETNLVSKLLPPEGDFQAIIIDALAGNDTIIVGPTVQKSVWIDAGDDDDQVTIRGGRAILADKAEIGKTDGLIGRNEFAALAYPLSVPAGGVQFDALTFDHVTDIDWFKFTLPSTAGTLNVKTASPIDDLQVQIFAADGETQLASATGLQFATLNLDTFGLEAGTQYLLRIQTNKTPTIYGIEFNFGIVGPIPVVDLGTRSDAVRRDIILGGRGDDVLMGGPGEDWILGGDGNDVISGGLDRGAPDLLIGGAGDDTFQIIPDHLRLLGNQPNTVFDPASKTYLPTMNDEIDGGSGNDRMLYVGGNLDRRGFEVPDFAAMRYNTGLHRYEFTSLVWDIGQQKFLHDYVDTNSNGQQDTDEADLTTYQRQYLFYQARNVENTQIELQAGDDTFHADPSYVFPGTLEEWGIKLGNYQQGATEAGLTIVGGSGTDELFGGAMQDAISGGPGDDVIFGSLGNDHLLGNGGNDQVFGLKDTSATPLTPRNPNQIIGRPSFGFSEEYRYELVAPFFALPEAGRPGVNLNSEAYKTGPIVHFTFDTPSDLGRNVGRSGFPAQLVDVTYVSNGINRGAAGFLSPGSKINVQPILQSHWTASAWFKNLKDNSPETSLLETLLYPSDGNEYFMRIGIEDGTSNLGITIDNHPSPGESTFYTSGFDIWAAVGDNQWHQLTMVATPSGVDFYLDGESVGQAVLPVLFLDEYQQLLDINSHFSSELDEFHMFLEAFTPEQVAEHFVSSQRTSEQLVSEAFGFEGATANERLSTLRTIGDFNGDGYEDFIASSDTTSYVLLGPVQLDSIERIDQVADIIIDHAAFGRPATNDGDINGDGISDLAFERNEAGTSIVTVVLGGQTMNAGPSVEEQPWQRFWGQEFKNSYVDNVGPSSFRTINFQGLALSDRVNVHLLDMDGDKLDDIAVVAESTVQPSVVVKPFFSPDDYYTIGFAYSGKTIADFTATTEQPQLTAYDQLATIRSKEASSNIQATVAGDVNGDGKEELLFGNRFMTSRIDNYYENFALKYQPNLTLANGFGSVPLTFDLNGIVASIPVTFKKASNTLEEIVDQINVKLATTELAGLVLADIDESDPANAMLRFRVIQGVALLAVVGPSNVNPLGINHTASTAGTWQNQPAQPIPDAGPSGPGAVTVSSVYPGNNIITDMDVLVSIKHTWASDLTITMISPDGQRVRLASGAGGSGDNFGTFDSNGNPIQLTRFNDASSVPISNGFAPFTTQATGYIPDEPLSQFNGKSTFGVWKLEITDSAQADVGEIVDFQIIWNTRRGSGLAQHRVDINSETSFTTSPLLPSISGQLPFDNPNFVPTRPLHYLFTIDSFGDESGTPYALSDLNNDGRDDFAIVGAIPSSSSPTTPQTSIYLGRADKTVPAEPDAYIFGSNSVLTSGDFDGDGKLDLAGTTVGSELSSLFVIHNVAEFFQSNQNSSGRFEWNQADTIIPYVDEFQATRRLSTVDLNGDGIDDIAISSSLAESQNGNVQAGQVYVAYGALKQVELPTAGIFDIENFSVPGSGSFVVNPETGRSEVFSDAGKPFSLSAAADEKWFRFTTLGDGKPGDAIRWLPETEAVTLIAEQPVNSPRRRAQDLDVEFWTRAFDAYIEQSMKLPHVSIQGTGDGTYDYYKFTATAGSRAIFDIDNNNFDTELFLFDANGVLLASNDDGVGPGADAGQGTGLASYIDYTFSSSGTFVIGVAKYNSSASGGEITGPAPAVGDVYRLNVSVDRHQVLGPVDLIDADGGVVAANQSVFDLRHVPAGTYYLRVHDTVSTFTFEFDAPSRGQFAGTTTLPDRDWIDGGDGDDVLVGNNDIDRIFGGSGADTITAEPIEIRDSTPGDVYLEVPTIERISEDVRPIIDPLVETGNAALNRAIASAIGRPIVWDASGIPQIYGGVRASELASISTLDASGLGIQTYQGLEHLTNLQSLDISNNRVATQNGTFFGGHYAIVSENTNLVLSFGSSVTISGLAIYNGYANRDDGTYTLRDAAGNVLGSWTISGTTGASNEGVDSFWLVFDSPITTSSLTLTADSVDGTTVSYREIEVFQAGATNRPNVGPAAGHLRINAGSSFHLAAHQTETGDNMSSNPDVTSGLGGTRIAYTPTGTFPISGGQNGATQLNNGDVSLANFDTLVGLSNLRALDLSGNSRVTNVQRLSELNNLQSIDLRGTEVWVSAFFPTEYFLSLDLKQLHLTVTGLSTDEHNLTAPQGTTVNLTKAVAGNWIVLGPNSSSFSGSGTTITFTADHAGIYRVYPTGSADEAIFPFLVTNVAPVISGTPQVVTIDEGDSRTVDQLLTAAGLTISDAGSTPPTRQVTVTSSSGVVTDLTTGSLVMNNDVIYLDPAILDAAGDVTVAIWLQTTASGFQSFLSAANAANDNALLIASSNSTTLSVWTNGLFANFTAATPFNDGDWHHIVVVRNESNQSVSVFLDGQQLGNAVPWTLTPLQVDANGLLVGQEQDALGGGFDPNRALNGKLDDLGIWRRALTAAQITDVYSNGVVGNEADLAAYYPFNELGGDIANDRSSNSRNGVIASIDTATPVLWSPDSQFAVGSFQPLNEGDFSLTVVAHDLQGASARAEAMIQVINVAPTAVMTPLNPGTVVAGQSVQFNALASTDPGVNDALSYFWEVLYDGSPADSVSSESNFAFTPAFAGSYEVKLTVTDSAGASSTITSLIAVNPSIPVVANHTGNEGDVFVFDTDSVSPKAATATRTHLWRVLAGGVAIDTGTAPIDDSTFAFAAPDNDSYSVELTITDAINSEPFSTTQIVSTVVTSNVAPTIAFGATTFVTEGTQATLAPAIIDAGSADTLTYLWTIVDENSNAVPLTTPGNLASVGFIPQDNGTYTATLTVTDDDGAATLPTSTTIIVANAAPVVEPASNRPGGGNQEFNEGTNQNHASMFFYFSEVGPLDFNSPFTYQVDFGDGTQEEWTGNRYSQDFFVVSHTYADSGVYIVNFTLIDKDGAAGTATRRVQINNLAPQNVTVSGPATADEDTTVTFTGTAADIHNFIPGSPDNEPLRALVDFGDGTELPTTLQPRLNLVAEVEPNNTYATGQDLETLSWSNAYNPALRPGQGPHVSIRGTGNGTDDWYRFVVAQSDYAEISVRDATFDAVLSLVNVATGSLTTGDLWAVQPDYIMFGSNETAEYAILVQRSDGAGGGMPLQDGDDYIIDFIVHEHAFDTLPFEDLKNNDFTVRHVYANPGTYNVSVTVWDDDGGRTTSPMATITIADTTAPIVTAEPIAPNLRNTAVDAVNIVFNKPITNFELSDLTLARDGGADLLVGSGATLTDQGNGLWTLGNLSEITNSEGNYLVRLNHESSGIVDELGLALNNTLRLIWTADFTAPVVTVDPLTTVNNRPRLSGTVNDPAAMVMVTIEGNTYSAENLRDGTWRLPADTIDPLPVGPYNVSATATDAASNIGVDDSTNELVILEAPDSDPFGNLVTIVLPSGTAHDIVVRRSGENLQVIDLAGPTVLSDTQLSATSGLRIFGSDTDADAILIDMAAGGFFRLPAGIDVIGGDGPEDSLWVTGTGNTKAVYSMTMSPVGQTQVTLFDDLGSNTIRYSEQESLQFDQLLSFGANSLLNIGNGETLAIEAQTPVDLGSLTIIADGTLRSLSTLVLGASESIFGSGVIEAAVAGETGSLIKALGELTIGDASSPIGFATRGELNTGPHSVTLLDSNQAVLGSLTQLGETDISAGNIFAANGILVDFGHNVKGWGTLHTPNVPGKLLMHNGAVLGNSSTELIELTGYIKGVGTLDNAHVTGTYSPGFSPAVIHHGSLSYGNSATTILEIGGVTPGSSGHDQTNHEGAAALAGTLQIELINGFEPALGQSFTLMTATEGFDGAFDHVEFPSAPTGAGWHLVRTANALRLELVDLAEVLGVVVGDSQSSQRSNIDSVQVTFDGAVDIDTGAFMVTKRGVGGGSVNSEFTTTVDEQGNTIATVTFSGSFTRAGFNLVDGNYQLYIDPSKVRRAGTLVRLDGDGDGQAGGDFVFGNEAADKFYAMFGESNGDRNVGFLDFLRFRNTFGSSSGDSSYNQDLDFNDDDAVGFIDFLAFRSRFGTNLPFE
ncbi:PKD domain-containing protein [Planctomycetaceae bacterium SH139]